MTAPEPYINDPDFRLYIGDVREVLRELPDGSVDTVVTSPPYLDARPEYDSLTPAEWREFFHELRRVVIGPALFNCGRVWREGRESDWALRLIQTAGYEGWMHVDTLVWIKPNANPIHGKVFSDSHEYIYVLAGAEAQFNTDAIRTPYADEAKARMARRWVNGAGVKGSGRHQENREINPLGARPRSYIAETVGQEKGNEHPAPMVLNVALHMVKVASWPGQTVLDPFLGSGTTALAARSLGRKSVGIELNPEYAALAAKRLQQLSLLTESTT